MTRTIRPLLGEEPGEGLGQREERGRQERTEVVRHLEDPAAAEELPRPHDCTARREPEHGRELEPARRRRETGPEGEDQRRESSTNSGTKEYGSVANQTWTGSWLNAPEVERATSIWAPTYHKGPP